MPIERWTILDERILPAGKYRKVRDTTFQLPDGRKEIYTIKHTAVPLVCVLPITVDGMVVLARQFRPGPVQILDELPGGGVETGETNMEAICRELMEETGYQPSEIVSLGFPVECAYSDTKREAFLATGCKKIAVPNPDENEFIEVVTKSIDAFIKQLIAGECTDLAIGWMGLYRLGAIKET